MLFENLRKKIWFKKVRAATDLSSELETKIKKFDTNQQLFLSKIAKTFDPENTKDKAVFKLALKIFVKDRSAIDKAISDTDNIRNFIDKLINSHAKSITVKVIQNFSSIIPKECSINGNVINQAIVELLLSDRSKAKAYSQIEHKIENNPAKFIDGYDAYLTMIAEKLFNSALSKLQQGLPEGCSIKKSLCVEEIFKSINSQGCIHIFKNDIAYNEIISELIKKINEAPEDYIDGFSNFLNETAENIFNQINSQVAVNFPSGVSMNKVSCIRLICDLIKQGCEPSNIAENFFDALNKNPHQYIIKVTQPSNEFRSSPTYSAGKDNAMLSSPSRYRF